VAQRRQGHGAERQGREEHQRQQALKAFLLQLYQTKAAFSKAKAKETEWQRLAFALCAAAPLRVKATQAKAAKTRTEERSAVQAAMAQQRRPRTRLAALAAALRRLLLIALIRFPPWGSSSIS